VDKTRDWRCARCTRSSSERRFCCRFCGYERPNWSGIMFRVRLPEAKQHVKSEQLELPEVQRR
jgi:hypothetical protein